MGQCEMSNEKDPRTHALIGAAMEVHRELGCGFLEAVYRDAMAIELRTRSIPFRNEVDLPVLYKGLKLPTHYRADFVCFDDVVLELKAIRQISGVEDSQLINYLKATGLQVGLLLNFGAPSLEWKQLDTIAAAEFRTRALAPFSAKICAICGPNRPERERNPYISGQLAEGARSHFTERKRGRDSEKNPQISQT